MLTTRTRIRRLAATGAVSFCLLAAAAGCSENQSRPMPASDLESIKRADRAYAAAWLSNDPDEVMAALTHDATIVPSGMPGIEGPDAIRQFWWPEGSPPTTVTDFDLVQRDVRGQGDIGFVRGSFTLGFEYDGAAYTGRGEYFTILRRLPDASWRISHRMWSDGPPQGND